MNNSKGFLFLYLAYVNIFDAIATVHGLSLSVIEEMNPYMDSLYSTHPMLFLLLKVSMSSVLMILYWYKLIPKTKWIRALVMISSVIYTPVCFVHMYWLCIYYL